MYRSADHQQLLHVQEFDWIGAGFSKAGTEIKTVYVSVAEGKGVESITTGGAPKQTGHASQNCFQTTSSQGDKSCDFQLCRSTLLLLKASALDQLNFSDNTGTINGSR